MPDPFLQLARFFMFYTDMIFESVHGAYAHRTRRQHEHDTRQFQKPCASHTTGHSMMRTAPLQIWQEPCFATRYLACVQ